VLFGPLCTMGSRRDTFGPSSRSSRRCLTSFVLRISYLVLVFCYLACSLAKIKASSCHSNPPTHTHNTIWKLPEMACLYAHTHRHTQTDTPGRKHLHLRTHGSLEGGVAHAFLFFFVSVFWLSLPNSRIFCAAFFLDDVLFDALLGKRIYLKINRFYI